MVLPTVVIIAGLAIAVVTDVRTRRIQNALTASMVVAAFGIAVMSAGTICQIPVVAFGRWNSENLSASFKSRA